MSNILRHIPYVGFGSWQEPVDTVGDLPLFGNESGDVRVIKATTDFYGWDGTSWLLIGGPSFASGLTDLNGLTIASQFFATGTAGTDFNIVSSVATHTFNIPDAGPTSRGVITNVAQTIAGAKTFSSAPTISPFTTAGIVHNDASGLLSSNLIIDADIDIAANISLLKLAALTLNRALISNGSGNIDVSSVTSTELSYVSGVTSSIQTQLNNKQPLDATLTALAAYNTNGYLVQTATDTFVGRTITAGTGITVNNGDGVSGNTSVAITDTAVTPGTYGSATQVGVFTVNQQGQITNAVNTTISLTSSNISDFNEAAQDAVGGILTDTTTIDFTYNDGVPSITADVVALSITNALISNSAAIDRTKLASGSANHVIINDGSGVLSSEAQLALTRGGTNASLTAVNGGVVYSNASAFAITTAGTSGQLLQSNGAAAPTWVSQSVLTGIDHGNLVGLLDDDHTQYALLVGRSGGQTLTGGTAASNNLVLRSTTNATKGQIYVDETTVSTSSTTGALRVNGGVGIGESLYVGNDFSINDTNDSYIVRQYTVTTTDATTTTLATLPIATNSVELIEARISAFRTAGGGSAADCATYVRTTRAKNAAGTVTENNTQTSFTSEDVAGWNATFDVSGTDIRVRVTGTAATTVVWRCTIIRQVNLG